MYLQLISALSSLLSDSELKGNSGVKVDLGLILEETSPFLLKNQKLSFTFVIFVHKVDSYRTKQIIQCLVQILQLNMVFTINN